MYEADRRAMEDTAGSHRPDIYRPPPSLSSSLPRAIPEILRLHAMVPSPSYLHAMNPAYCCSNPSLKKRVPPMSSRIERHGVAPHNGMNDERALTERRQWGSASSVKSRLASRYF